MFGGGKAYFSMRLSCYNFDIPDHKHVTNACEYYITISSTRLFTLSVLSLHSREVESQTAHSRIIHSKTRRHPVCGTHYRVPILTLEREL
jgi:hypothetical protein